MKKVILILTLALAVFVVSGCKQKAESEVNQKPIVKIGVICPLTGNLAFYGTDLRDGILLAQKELGKNTKFDYQLIFEDDEFDTKKTALAVQKLINVNKVDCLVTMFSNAGLMINPMAEQNKIIHFGIAYDPQVAAGFYNFNHWAHISQQVEVAIKHLTALPCKKVGILALNEKGDLAAMNEFKKQLESTDKTLVFEELFNPGERDFRSLLMKAKESGAEIFFVVVVQPELDILMKQMRDLGMQNTVFSLNDFRTIQTISLYEGAFYADRDEPTSDFSQKFESQYQHAPGLLAPNGFDIVNLIVAAYEKASTSSQPTTEAVVNLILASPNFDGALGKTTIDSEGVLSSPFILKEIKNGERIILK
ncbi:MAG: ABC transporter substrate-binding protein [Verrucomicrobiota bacterium]